MKDGLYTRHEVACIITELFGDTCACNINCNDEWLPYYCEFSDNVCPNTVGVACWEQYLLHKGERKKPIFSHNLSDTLSVFHCECGNTIKVSHDVGIMNNNNAPNYCSKCGCRLDWEEKMFEGIERIIVETEEGEEIATIINDDKIDESITVADGYTVRIKPKAN